MIKGSHIGVIGGSGRIGRSVIKRLRSFEPGKISYTSRHEHPGMFREFNAEFYSLDRLLTESDIIIVCCSLNDSTRRLINTEQFERMKSSSVIINTSRGSCIDQQALFEALKSKKIAAAGLDVYEQEPISMDDPLLSLDNVGKFFSPQKIHFSFVNESINRICQSKVKIPWIFIIRIHSFFVVCLKMLMINRQPPNLYIAVKTYYQIDNSFTFNVSV